MKLRLVSLFFLINLVGCSFGRPVTEQLTPTRVVLTPTLPVPTLIPTATAQPVATATAMPELTTLRVRIVSADSAGHAPLMSIIEKAAANVGLDVNVDVRSPDGALALQQGVLAGDVVDVWVAGAVDVWQLDQRDALSTAPITSDFAAYPFVAQGISMFGNRGVAPIAAQNYFISIYNTEILSSAPPTTSALQSMPGLLLRPRYQMAFPWAEGRWFDGIMEQLQATTVLTDGKQALNTDATTNAMQTLVDLRNLGPNDVTSYVESTTDFLYSRVPYTLDGDAALRRYAVFSDTLLLDYALPPLIDASSTMWLPGVDVVYAAIPADIDANRRTQVLQLIRQLQRRDVQLAMFADMRWIPARNDVLTSLPDDRLAVVLDQVGTIANAQRYSDAVVCRWDAYEQVLPYALLNIWRIRDAVEQLSVLLADCPVEANNSLTP